jgi:hypothetical protein
MKLKTVSALVLGVFLLAAPALAHDADGKWSGTVATPMGDVQVGFELKADGTGLTGTTTGPDGAAVAIKDGKVDGNTITFSVSIDAGGMPLELGYKGVVTPGEIKFTLEVFGMPFEFTVKKS